jgi:hypothetical protein
MDIRMPAMDGLTATREITALPDPPRIIMLTTFELDEYGRRDHVERRHPIGAVGRPSNSPVVGSRPSNMAWNPATDASPSSARLLAPAPYHRPGLSPWADRYASWSVASSRV